MKNDKDKKALLEHLRKTPIIQFGCERAGVSRATFYRWRKEDKAFSAKADKAITEGTNLINDMAESQLLSAIKDRNLTGIIFWLKNHKQIYSDKLKISGSVVTENKLTKEQEESIKKALTLAFSATEGKHEKTK